MDANLSGAILTDADLTGADLKGADFTGAQVDPAHVPLIEAAARNMIASLIVTGTAVEEAEDDYEDEDEDEDEDEVYYYDDPSELDYIIEEERAAALEAGLEPPLYYDDPTELDYIIEEERAKRKAARAARKPNPGYGRGPRGYKY
jgi:hypothetical protein